MTTTVTATFRFAGGTSVNHTKDPGDLINDPLQSRADSSSSSFSYAYTNSKTGDVNPRYKQQIASASSATTVFTGTRYHANGRPGYCYTKSGASPYQKFPLVTLRSEELRGDYGAVDSSVFSSWSETTSGEAFSKANRKFINQAMSELRTTLTGATLGELRKTIRMVRSPAKPLVSLFQDYLGRARALPRRGSTKLRNHRLSNLYLESVYGWQPLLYDIQGATRLLAELVHGKPFLKVTSLSATGSAAKLKQSSSGNLTSASITLVKVNTLAVEWSSVRMRGAIASGVPGAKWAGLSDQAGLGFSSFIPTIWELFPYSFAIDYFANVSNIIDAACYVNSSLRWANSTTRTQLTYERYCDFVAVPSDAYPKAFIANRRPSSYKEQKTTTSRQVLTSVIPSFGLRLPEFGSMQSLNLAVLALSKIR